MTKMTTANRTIIRIPYVGTDEWYEKKLKRVSKTSIGRMLGEDAQEEDYRDVVKTGLEIGMADLEAFLKTYEDFVKDFYCDLPEINIGIKADINKRLHKIDKAFKKKANIYLAKIEEGHNGTEVIDVEKIKKNMLAFLVDASEATKKVLILKSEVINALEAE